MAMRDNKLPDPIIAVIVKRGRAEAERKAREADKQAACPDDADLADRD